jgi:hypothetical protein
MFFGKGKSKEREGKGKGRELVNGAVVSNLDRFRLDVDPFNLI